MAANLEEDRHRVWDPWRFVVFLLFGTYLARGFFPPTYALGFQLAHWSLLAFGAFILSRSTRPVVLRLKDWLVLFGLLGLALMGAVTSTYGPDPMNSLAQAAMLIVTVAFLWVTFTARWSSSLAIRKDLIFLFWLFTLAAGIGCVGFLLNAPWSILNFRYEGIFSNPNYAGAAAAIGISLCLIPLREARTPTQLGFVLFGVAIQGASLILSESRGSLLALVVGITAVVITRYRMWLATAICVALATFLILLSPPLLKWLVSTLSHLTYNLDAISSGRIQIYAVLIDRWAKAPITGTGYRTTELFPDTFGITAHNIFLQALVETGVIGLGALVGLLTFIFIAGHSPSKVSPLLVAIVVALSLELPESTLFGFGSALTSLTWLVLLAYAALGRYPEAFIRKVGGIRLALLRRHKEYESQ